MTVIPRAPAPFLPIDFTLHRAERAFRFCLFTSTGAAVRTPITKAKKGGLKDACPEDLLAAVFKAVVERSGVDPALVEDIAVGNVLPPGGGATVARMAALYGQFRLLCCAMNPQAVPC